MHAIGDYGIIGDCRSAALISRDGSIDWLCWPRFDSPPFFGALLDERAGFWSIRPAGAFAALRRYRGPTPILETEFRGDSGVAVLTDFMPVASEEDKERHLFPEHELLRHLECTKGEITIDVCYEPRPGYDLGPVSLRPAGPLGLRLSVGSSLLTLRSDLPLEPSGPGRAEGQVHLRAGDQRHFSLTYAHKWPAVLPPVGAWTREALDRSSAWWRDWASSMTYDGPYREAVLRSALVLRLLVFAPSGAVVAAPTTSLPERVGGPLNWDYRYCWLRDASLTVRALFGLGYRDEAVGFTNWLLHTTSLSRPELRILYDVFGRNPGRERILERWSGYRNSRPVRVGNRAANQFQLDVYGEVLDALVQFIERGGVFDRATQGMLRDFGKFVCRHWSEADEGLWEPRSGRGHHTHSRLLCWVALDRLLELRAKGHVVGLNAEDLERNRELIRKDIETRAWNEGLESYAATLDGDRLDASSLLIPWYGFEAASSERMRKTYERIRRSLGASEGLLFRYRSGESPGEGAFGIASFWGAEYLALGGGSFEEASRMFEGLLRLANDLGLYAEEMDPGTGAPLGNFPQAFTHVGLINAALSLERRAKGQTHVRRRVAARGEARVEEERHL